MSEVTCQRIALIENISRIRVPMKDFDAIYFIAPNSKSVRLLMADFENGKELYRSEII